MTLDLVLKGNVVFTGLKEQPEPLSIGVKGNTIEMVAPFEKIEPFIGKNTILKSYTDQLIMPGFFDAHEHAFLGGIFSRAVDLSDCKSEESAARKVRGFAEQHPELTWIIGTDWSNINWTKKDLPDKNSLDKLLPDQPVYLINAEGHSAWINSKALELSKLGENVEFSNELVARDSNGVPTGYIVEAAMLEVARLAFDMPMSVQGEILHDFQKRASSLGITSVSNIQCYQGSDIDLGNLEIIKQFEDDQCLDVRFFVAVGLTGDLARGKKLRKMYKSDLFRFSALKHIIDGTATGWTALMLEPYHDKPDSYGSSRITAAELEHRIIAADKENFRIRLHACGDGSVRRGLDCFEKALNVNGHRDSRHTIEHIEIIEKSDIARFKKLGVIASMQPDHISTADEFKNNPYFDRLGVERAAGTWPIKSIINTGAHIQFGTDYPIYDNNPMLAIYRATTRVFNDGEPEGGWNGNEKITLAESLKAYTAGSAYGAFMEDKLGTLEQGKLADLIVLDKDLFNLDDSREILNTSPLLTIMNGRIVFERSI